MDDAAGVGIEVDEVTPERVTATMQWAEERCTTGGILHGGALMAFADTVGALCAAVNLPPAAGTATIESKTMLTMVSACFFVSWTTRATSSTSSAFVITPALDSVRSDSDW